MIIDKIDEDSPYLQAVKDLGRSHKRTLGFFPDGAFNDYASREEILVARNKVGEVYGYLMFRTTWRDKVLPTAVIVHLCIDKEHRNKGIANKLVTELRKITEKTYIKIQLKCRRDFSANSLWPKIGFINKGEYIGKSGLPLLLWEIEFKKLPLLALMESNQQKNGPIAVLDANVLYRLQDNQHNENIHDNVLYEEANALTADWLSGEVSYYITNETFNEIERNDNAETRSRRRAFACGYPTISISSDIIGSLALKIDSIFSISEKESRKSDIRQLAYAVAGNADFFITQDRKVLNRHEAIEDKFGIIVVAPGEFIGRIDEILRELEYRPSRLSSTRTLLESKVKISDLDGLYAIFKQDKPCEKRGIFETKLRHFIANNQVFEVLKIANNDGSYLALIVYDRSLPGKISVPLLRISNHPLASTILRYLLRKTILLSLAENCSLIDVTDDIRDQQAMSALIETGFIKTTGQWSKCSLKMADNSENILNIIEKGAKSANIQAVIDQLKLAMDSGCESSEMLLFANLEKLLWPVKFVDCCIPTFIVPIKAIWAQHLFDERLAERTLWGSKEELVLGNENVYYKSTRNSGNISAPARILWYISYDKNSPDLTKSLIACSMLNEVAVGKAKDLYKRFKRLGIYSWKNIYKIANENAYNDIMALRFSGTEIFEVQIELQELQRLLETTESKKLVVRSPQKIKPRTFSMIYNKAFPTNRGN